MTFQCKGILAFPYLGRGARVPVELLPVMIMWPSAQTFLLALQGWAECYVF